MSVQFIIRLVSYVGFVILLGTLPLRVKYTKEKLGNLLLVLSHKKFKLAVVVFVFVPILIFIQRFRGLELYLSIVLCGVALLATEISIRDLVLGQMSGVYENGLVIESRFFPFSAITSLPTLAYENDDQEQYEKSLSLDAKETNARSLKIVTEKAGIVFVGFETKQERDDAVKIILDKNPRLKP